jgi:O-antigen/teichoic acid export membrane protein
VGVIGLAEPIVRLVYGAAFLAAVPLLQIQTTAFLLTTLDAMLMMICRATGFQRADLRIVFLSAIANLLLSALLIAGFDAAGAAWAGSLSMLIGLILRWRLVMRAIVQLNWSRLVGAPFAASALLIPAVLALTAKLPWIVVAAGYAVIYIAIALVSFPFVHDAAKRVLRQYRPSAS